MSKLKYHEALKAMQAAIGMDVETGTKSASPKHLRVGINSAMIDTGAIARLLIKKGVFTEQEFDESLEVLANEEVASYEKLLSEKLAAKVTLGYDATLDCGFVDIKKT
jgi:hypothetical protein